MRVLDKYLYVFLAAGALMGLMWLHFAVIPNLVVAKVEDSQKGYGDHREVEQPHAPQSGAIFVNVTTPSAKHASLRMLGDPLKVVSFARGWQAVGKGLPFALICAMVGSIPGFLAGKWSTDDQYKEHAGLLIASYEDKIRRSEEKLGLAEELKKQAVEEIQRAEHRQHQAQELQTAAAAKIALADERTADAERKLAKECEDHQKTVAQLLKYKRKGKADKEIDTDKKEGDINT